jgi:hypothetical protein
MSRGSMDLMDFRKLDLITIYIRSNSNRIVNNSAGLTDANDIDQAIICNLSSNTAVRAVLVFVYKIINFLICKFLKRLLI